MPPGTHIEIGFEWLAHSMGLVGLLCGAFLGFTLSLVAERADAVRGRPGNLRGEAVAASGVLWVLPLLVVLVVTTTTTILPAPPGGGAPPRPYTTVAFAPLAAWAAIPFLVPAAITALIQLAAVAAGRGHPAPLRRATRFGRRALTVLLCLGALGYEAYTDTPAACVAVLAAAVLLPFAWAALAARSGGPGTRLALLGALVLFGFFEWPYRLDGRELARVLPPLLLNGSLPAACACAALEYARLDRRTLDALGIDVDAPGDLAAASLVLAPLLYAVIGLTLVVSGNDALARALVEDGFALWWTPLLTSGLVTAAILYLGRVVHEARVAARERAEAPGPPAAAVEAP